MLCQCFDVCKLLAISSFVFRFVMSMNTERSHGHRVERRAIKSNHSTIPAAQPQAGDPDSVLAKDGRYAKKRSALGASLVFAAPGIPMLFQGQEFLSDKWFTDDRPIDWSCAEEFKGMAALHRDLIALRLNRKKQTAGLSGQHVEVFHVNDTSKLIAMRRWREGGPGDDVIAIFKFVEGRKEKYQIGLPSTGTWKLRFNGDLQLYDPAMDATDSVDLQAVDEPRDGFPYSAIVTTGAYAWLIYITGSVILAVPIPKVSERCAEP